MKRSERLFSKAIHVSCECALLFMVSVGMGAWTVRAAQSIPILSAGMLVLTLIVFSLAIHKGREALRLIRLSDIESHWEHEREIRPRL